MGTWRSSIKISMTHKKDSPTKDELLHFFLYNREFGTLTWKNHWYRPTLTKVLGKIAGVTDSSGYRVVRLKRKGLKIHRLIWFLEYGTWPKMIDHIDGNKSNNVIQNLRASDNRRNQQNRKRHRLGKLVGASFCNTRKKWQSVVQFSGKSKHLGIFSSELEAHRAYVKALLNVYDS